ncbi:MAG TPA: RDD family protein [Ktedonobacteraceae bacterium]|nr:RDD family protein [Ktedonobacteraceae bacterium]
MSSLANLRLRFAAFLLDYLIIAAYIILLIAVSVSLGLSPLRQIFKALFSNPNSGELSAFLLLVLPVILYFALFECSAWQATWGKRKLGLWVTDIHGTRLSFVRSLVRSLLKFLPWELTHACLWRIPGWPFASKTPPPIITVGLVLVWIIVGAYVISLLTSKTHQTLYDRIAGSYVVMAPHPSSRFTSIK